LWLLKCGLRAPEIVKIGNLSYKFAKKGYNPLRNFYKFHVYRGNVLPLRGEKPIFGPLSKNNTAGNK